MEFTLKQNKSPMGSELSTQQNKNVVSTPFWFSVCFAGYMDMHSDLETVAEYLNAHENWFCRCAQPMTVQPLNENGYILNIGRFASLGYEVEPKIAVVIDPPEDHLYVMRTVPVPNYYAPGYEVQYKALMELAEMSAAEIEQPSAKIFAKKPNMPSNITKVSWQLDLTVAVEFPKFIEKLPAALVQKTGDRLLAQIVRQISPRLTYKVQQDFHTSHNLPLPSKKGRSFAQMAQEGKYGVSLDDDETALLSYEEQNSSVPSDMGGLADDCLSESSKNNQAA